MGCVSSTLTYRTKASLERGWLFVLLYRGGKVLSINERASANGGGRSEGLRPGAAGYFRGGAPKKQFKF